MLREVTLRVAEVVLNRRSKHVPIIHKVGGIMHPSGNRIRPVLCNIETAPVNYEAPEAGAETLGALHKEHRAFRMKRPTSKLAF